LKDPKNGSTLQELKFKSNEILGAYRKSAYSTPREPVLEDSDSGPVLTKQTKSACFEIFKEFASVDLNGEFYMNLADCIKFTAKCTAQPSSEDDIRVQTYMKNYSLQREFTPESLVPLKGLEQFCIDSCVEGREDKLRSNFRRLGYA